MDEKLQVQLLTDTAAESPEDMYHILEDEEDDGAQLEEQQATAVYSIYLLFLSWFPTLAVSSTTLLGPHDNFWWFVVVMVGSLVLGHVEVGSRLLMSIMVCTMAVSALCDVVMFVCATVYLYRMYGTHWLAMEQLGTAEFEEDEALLLKAYLVHQYMLFYALMSIPKVLIKVNVAIQEVRLCTLVNKLRAKKQLANEVPMEIENA